MKVQRSREEPGCSEMIIKVKSDIQSTYKGQNEGSTSPVGPTACPSRTCLLSLRTAPPTFEAKIKRRPRDKEADP